MLGATQTGVQVELNFKNIALLMVIAGGIYAWYSGLLDGFLGDFGGALGKGGTEARQVE